MKMGRFMHALDVGVKRHNYFLALREVLVMTYIYLECIGRENNYLFLQELTLI